MSAGAAAYARFGARLASGTIDLVLLLCAAAVLTWLGLEIGAAAIQDRVELLDAMARLWREGLLIPATVAVIAGMTLCWTFWCATPGQLLMGCRVLSLRGMPLHPLVALWRSLALLATAGPAAVPLATMFVDRRRRGLHDWLSGAVVVMEDESEVSLDEWLRRIE